MENLYEAVPKNTIYVHSDSRIIVKYVSDIGSIEDADTDQQALNLITFMERGLPNRVVLRVCELLEANPNRIIKVGEQHKDYKPAGSNRSANERSKLSKENVIAIKRLRNQISIKATAEAFGVSRKSIEDIWAGRTWTSIIA